jgi:hypothetical protein
MTAWIASAAAADLVSTEIAITRGASEQNPVLSEDRLQRIVLKTALTLVEIRIVAFLDRRGAHGTARFVTTVAVAGWLAVAVANQLRVR